MPCHFSAMIGYKIKMKEANNRCLNNISVKFLAKLIRIKSISLAPWYKREGIIDLTEILIDLNNCFAKIREIM